MSQVVVGCVVYLVGPAVGSPNVYGENHCQTPLKKINKKNVVIYNVGKHKHTYTQPRCLHVWNISLLTTDISVGIHSEFDGIIQEHFLEYNCNVC